jgi:hypothetical protein
MDSNNKPDQKHGKRLVKVYTSSLEIEGEITINTTSYKGRTLDILNDGREFIAITDAKVYNIEGKLLNNTNFIAINKNAITILMELEEYKQN